MTPLSDRRVRSSSIAEPGSFLQAPLTGSSDRTIFSGRWLRRLAHLVCGTQRSGIRGGSKSFRPIAEGLESKTLLSNLIGWNGGEGGTQSSAITPANISQLTQNFTDMVDGTITAEPLVASVNVTVGPNAGVQPLVFVATQHDSLYAFNLDSGQLVWHTSFLIPGQTVLYGCRTGLPGKRHHRHAGDRSIHEYDLPGVVGELRRRGRHSLHEDAPRDRYE